MKKMGISSVVIQNLGGFCILQQIIYKESSYCTLFKIEEDIDLGFK